MNTFRSWVIRNKSLFLFLGTTTVVYLGFQYLLPLFFPFLLAYFIAWIIRPFVFFLKDKLRLPYMLGGLFSILILLGILGTGLFFLGRLFVEQLISLLRNLPIFLSVIGKHIEGVCGACDRLFGLNSGTARLAVYDGMDSLIQTIQTDVLPAITQQTFYFVISIFVLIGVFFIIMVSALLIVKDMGDSKDNPQKSGFYPWVRNITKRLSQAGTAYLRVQAILMIIIAGVCTLGLFLIKNNYALVLGIGIAVIDALPVLGSGLVLVPWAVINFFQGQYFEGAIILSIFIICMVIRDILEPRMLGDRIGIRPIFALISIYVGLQLFGIFGVLLGPFGLVIINTIVHYFNEKDSGGGA